MTEEEESLKQKRRPFPVILSLADGFAEAARYLEDQASNLALLNIFAKVMKDKPEVGVAWPQDIREMIRAVVDGEAQVAATKATVEELKKLAAEHRALDARELAQLREKA